MTSDETWSALPGCQKQAILHVFRYWLTTINVFQRWLRPDLSQDGARKVLTRMVEMGWLARHLLAGQEPYFVLGQKAIAALGLRRPTKPLGHQAKLEHYAVLLACARRGCDVFTDDEFRSKFPDLSQPGQSARNFFLDASHDPARLGCFLVDHDKLSSRMVNKVGRRISKVFDTNRPAFRKLILDGQFAIHILTATEGKKMNLQAAFTRKPPRNVPVFVEAFPDDLGDFFLVKRR
jgi:hypothetical protein